MRIKIEKGPKMEFSKKILIFSGSVNLLIILFTLIMVWRTENLEPLIYLIPAASGAAAVGEGFYYNKAKTENRIKLMKENKVEMTEESFKEEV